MRLLLQQLEGDLCDVTPRLLDVTGLGGAGTDGESQDEAARQLAGNQVDFLALCDLFQQVLVELIGAL